MIDNDIGRLINECLVFRDKGSLLITCFTDDHFRLLIENYKLLPQALASDFSCITIATHQRKISFPEQSYHMEVENNLASIIRIPQSQFQSLNSRVPNEDDNSVISEVLTFSGSASVVRLSDDKGLFSNSQIITTSGISANDWVGKLMSPCWLPDELLRYKQALLKDLRVNNFSYTAYMFTGELARFTVDARLTNYRGELVRVVKCLACELLS